MVNEWEDGHGVVQIKDALRDTTKPGRPSKLSEAERKQVAAWLEESPAALGHDAEPWTAALLRDRVAEEFGVDYSTTHVARTFLSEREEFQLSTLSRSSKLNRK